MFSTIKFYAIVVLMICFTRVSAEKVQAEIIVAGRALSNPDTLRQFYSLNSTNGLVTPISPASTIAVNGLGATQNGQFYGSVGSNLVKVNISTNTTENIGTIAGILAFEIGPDDRAFAIAAGGLRTVNLSNAATRVVVESATIGNALVSAGGTNFQSIQSLGSVGSNWYGINNASGLLSLMSFNPDLGTASVVGGQVDLLATGVLSNGIARSRYSAYAALTGFDSNGDGQNDALLGAINSFDDDNNPGTAPIRFGGVGLFDLNSGSWELIGANPGIQFTSFTSTAVPEPTSVVYLSGLCLAAIAFRIFRIRANAQLANICAPNSPIP